jgi:hypothetical protein
MAHPSPFFTLSRMVMRFSNSRPPPGAEKRMVDPCKALRNSAGPLVLSSLIMPAHFLRIQTPHVTGPASSSVIGRPATLRASFI